MFHGFPLQKWCSPRESNAQARRQPGLSRPCLPFHQASNGLDARGRTGMPEGAGSQPAAYAFPPRREMVPTAGFPPARTRRSFLRRVCLVVPPRRLGTGPRDRTVLRRFVRARPSPEGEPSIGLRCWDRTSLMSCSRSRRPTLSPNADGSPCTIRTCIARLQRPACYRLHQRGMVSTSRVERQRGAV
jgi:hypothetical protein